MKLFQFIFFFTFFMLSFSVTLSNAHPKICPAALRSATSGMDIKGQMGFYQDSNGSLWLSGTYQYGFQDPKEWDYCYTIQNKCGDVLFNLTDSLCMEYAKDSGCDGYDDKSKSTAWHLFDPFSCRIVQNRLSLSQNNRSNNCQANQKGV
ncbi:hypothetical protein C2G38_2037585 [Gigaspora rosea]|uniref:Uncharacterized protein n=1 Tax=Gigaspora rosea TaxID=44941 RepID=A0A397V503_9GLOM|nr:hypothetical protein C2G38_2037585 [Gigaspora rosea]